jgi:hypothetical protein
MRDRQHFCHRQESLQMLCNERNGFNKCTAYGSLLGKEGGVLAPQGAQLSWPTWREGERE